jgi:glycosyltransferase involved in cell wall biosynthesis
MQWPGDKRNLFLCCVRLSPEKQPCKFVSVAAALSKRGVFKKLAVQPLLLAATSSPYAQEIVREFEEKVPEGRVEHKFMSAQELAQVFACTVLNFHPCEYDAYGMTVVEAASQGAPSIMHEVCFCQNHLSSCLFELMCSR